MRNASLTASIFPADFAISLSDSQGIKTRKLGELRK